MSGPRSMAEPRPPEPREPPTLGLVVSVAASLLAMPLVVELAVAADARAAGDTAPGREDLMAGIGIVGFFVVAGVLILVRPGLAALLFLVTAAISFLAGRDDGMDGLAVYGVLSLLLSGICLADLRRSHRAPSIGDLAADQAPNESDR